jgi:DNA-binding transcriptional MerR regulator
MISIGQLAEYAGVTVRAIRYYHQCGLLPEPPRDASGYRRYSASDLVELIKIATLADAGVPLARVGELLTSDPDQFAAAITEIDDTLRLRIARLRRTRQRIATLAGGDRLVVPADVADYLDRLRLLGVSDRYVQIERDGWILIRTAAPDHVAGWIAAKRALLDDDQFKQFCLDYDRCVDWEPDDERLDALARRMADWTAERYPDGDPKQATGIDVDPTIVQMIEDSIVDSSPAWKRLNHLVRTYHVDRTS